MTAGLHNASELITALQTRVEQAWSAEFSQLPAVTLALRSGNRSHVLVEEQRLAQLIVGGGDDSTGIAAPGYRQICVNVRSLDPGHVVLTLAGDTFELRNRGAGTILIFHNQNGKCVSFSVERDAVHRFHQRTGTWEFGIGNYIFELTVSAKTETIASPIQWATAPEVRFTGSNATTLYYDVAGHTISVAVGGESYSGDLIDRVMQAVSDTSSLLPGHLAGTVRRRLAGPDSISSSETYCLEATFTSEQCRAYLTVPRGLWQSLSGPDNLKSQPTRLTHERVLIAGSQLLSLDQLRRLGPACVVLLRNHSAGVLHPGTGQFSPLRLVAGAGSLYRLGAPDLPWVANGGIMTTNSATPDSASIPLVLQVILTTAVNSTELDRLTPGAQVNVDMTPGQPVQIAINSRVLGLGKLVSVDNRLGVQISGWH